MTFEERTSKFGFGGFRRGQPVTEEAETFGLRDL